MDGSVRPLFVNRFHQMAIYTDKPEFAVKQMKALGYTEWIHDQATLTGEVGGKQFSSEGRMWFNYEFYGDAGLQGDAVPHWQRRPSELEFLEYAGYSWHEAAGRTERNGQLPEGAEPFLSHMSCYVNDAEPEVDRLYKEYGLEVIQWFATSDHLNKYLKDKKQTFYEFIFDTRLMFGYDLKIIQRVQH